MPNHRRRYSFLLLVVLRLQLLRRVLLSLQLDPPLMERVQLKGLEGREAGHLRIRTRTSRPLLQSSSSSSSSKSNRRHSSSNSNTKNFRRTNRRLCIIMEAPLNSIIINLLTIIKDGCILANLRSMPTPIKCNSKLPLRQSPKARLLQEEGGSDELPKYQALRRVLVRG